MSLYRICICLPLALLVGGNPVSSADELQHGTEVYLTTSIDDPIEILFRIGLDELQRRNYSAAIGIFKALTEKTSSPRIRLELARALFLAHRYWEAEQVFNDLLQQPDIPWAVQENIRNYLEAIDDALGYVTFGFSLVSDSNPRNFTDKREIRIAGQTLAIIPPEDNQEVIGVRYSVNGSRALTETASVTGYLNASYADFEHDQFDRWVADFGLMATSLSLPQLTFRLGLEESFFAGYHQYEFPYLGCIFTPDLVDQFRASSELKIGQLRVPDAGYLDATNLSLTTRTIMQITPGIQAGGELYLEKSIADERAYSYYGGSLGGSLSFVFLEMWAAKPFASIGQRSYEADDPFFGNTRNDVRKVIGINVMHLAFAILGFRPEIAVGYEENTSNIDFYSYDKILFQLNLN